MHTHIFNNLPTKIQTNTQKHAEQHKNTELYIYKKYTGTHPHTESDIYSHLDRSE